MTLATSRGPAKVPAWLLTLKGYDSPLKRVVAVPSKLPRPPIGSAHDLPAGPSAAPDGLLRTAGGGRSLTVLAIHGSCDDGPAVKVPETSGSVVLSASVKNPRDGDCTSEARGQQVTVKLRRAVGDRALLDAYTGRPVPYGEPYDPSPSWS
ncbi:hypothetical protein [Streptomyces sp. NPDC002580]|uniref:hypothetical protein n=1 Tax=Streptomyces sp. NPDC002580 TaxID=3364653 RepID=UPI0036B27B47